MASQNLNVTSEANSGGGTGLRNAFINVRKMFAELYNITYSSDTQDISGTTFKVPLTTVSDQAANTVVVNNTSSSGALSAKAVTDQQILIGNGTGFTAAALSGDVTMANTGAVTIANDAVEQAMIADDAVGADQLASNAVVTASITDNNVTHDKLENRYTAKATSTATGSQDLNAADATTFLLTGNVATATLTIQNLKLGQVIDIVLSGTLSSAVITLATNFTSTTINKVGSTDLDQSATNVIQVVCIDDTTSAAIVNYSINTFAADTTP